MPTEIKKILLINPPWNRFFNEGSLHPPLGISYIAAILEKHNYKVSIYDADCINSLPIGSSVEIEAYNNYQSIMQNMSHPIWQEAESVISRESPDLVGITVSTPKYMSALNISRLVKKVNPSTPVVWGGVHPTILPNETIENEDIDIVVRSEGEYTFLDLTRNFNHLEGVLGITYKRNSTVIHNQSRPLIENLDDLPFPARHLLINKENYYPDSFGNILTSRGCPYNCIFCASNSVWTRKVRYRSAENIVREIKYIKDTFKTSLFRFEDDSFTLNQRFVESVCDNIIKEKLNIRWVAETRADLVNDKLIRKMKAAGCEDIMIGVESGDEETLQKIKKGITVEQIRDANAILKKNKMRLCGFFLIGFPWETREHINKTVSLMKELNPRVAVFSVATPYPGTELYNICVSEGLIKDKPDWSTFFHQSPDMYLTNKLTREEASKVIKETELIFEEHNRKKWQKMLLTNPLYLLRRIIKGGYYSPKNLWRLFRYLTCPPKSVPH